MLESTGANYSPPTSVAEGSCTKATSHSPRPSRHDRPVAQRSPSPSTSSLGRRSKSASKSRSRTCSVESMETGSSMYSRPSPGRKRRRDPLPSVKITGLTSMVAERHLEEIFDVYGTIRECFLPKFRRSNEPKGEAFILFNSTSAASKAIRHMDQGQIDGAIVSVESHCLPDAVTSHAGSARPKGRNGRYDDGLARRSARWYDDRWSSGIDPYGDSHHHKERERYHPRRLPCDEKYRRECELYSFNAEYDQRFHADGSRSRNRSRSHCRDRLDERSRSPHVRCSSLRPPLSPPSHYREDAMSTSRSSLLSAGRESIAGDAVPSPIRNRCDAEVLNSRPSTPYSPVASSWSASPRQSNLAS